MQSFSRVCVKIDFIVFNKWIWVEWFMTSHMFICLLWFCHELPKGEIVRTYVIHLLGTYVTILYNWLILWQNALYLYLGRFKMCLILQETLFRDQVLKPYKFVQDSSWKVSVINARQLTIYRARRAVQPYGSTAAWQIRYLSRFMKNKISVLFWL